ncbi:MAG: crossover junction endodeoxyribonuclease RuvC [Armatimonadota bacterium]
MRILGVDPGLKTTGYGLVETLSPHAPTGNARPRVLEGGVISTDPGAPLEQRLESIHKGMAEVIAEHQPDVVVVEELYAKYRHPRTAILMGHARGVICLAAASAGVPLQSYTASQVKKSLTGNGNASKDQIKRMVCRLFGLTKPPSPADVTDALALAICHASPGRGLSERLPSPKRGR